VIRAGRTTAAQRDALERLWPRYGVAGAGPLDPERLYGRRAPWVIEIGFGNGEALLALAGAHPNWDFLGIEVHPPGVGRLLAGLDAGGLGNVRVARQDALEVLGERVAPASVDGIHLWFPDPWPKKRHHKRRLVQPGFVALVARALKPGGWFHLATDWEDYARHMLEVCEREPLLANEAGPGRPLEGRRERPASRFERRGLELGHAVVDLCYRRRDGVTRPRA
jgi:tRNA (guanine-N7-)-methyltransferase